MEHAYIDLHGMGHAHSLEVWLDGELVGGIYGLAIGAVFFGESMFSGQTDGSKIALVALCRLMEGSGMRLLDCQVVNPHLRRMGAEEWPRDRFEAELIRAVHEPARFPASPASIAFDLRW
jgi:leucyl/phenylalanyl-tRNA--protein transferase